VKREVEPEGELKHPTTGQSGYPVLAFRTIENEKRENAEDNKESIPSGPQSNMLCIFENAIDSSSFNQNRGGEVTSSQEREKK